LRDLASAATLMTESHFKQWNLSKTRISSFDLRASIATPQIGHARLTAARETRSARFPALMGRSRLQLSPE
jgi:hypothetical protein